jgi:flagellar basal-body rod protein FlgG
MLNGYYQATGAMATQFNRLDVITHNLANINTTAFKREDVVIGDFERLYQEARDELPLKNHTKESAKFMNRTIDRVPNISEKYIQFEQGSLRPSGNPLDFALKRDDIFFLIETPQGIRLSQDGQFQLDGDGNLVDKNGFYVLSDFQEGSYINVTDDTILGADKSGNLYSKKLDGLENEPEQIGKLFIAQYSDVKKLQKDGDGYYRIPDNNEVMEADEGDYVAQGFYEISNVNPVNEMVALIEINRYVSMYQKVMTTHMDDLNKEAITKLAIAKA